MKNWLWILVFALIVLHQDFWFWNNDYLVGGIIPIGLAYHIGISMAATLVWLAATQLAWPAELQEEEIQRAKNM